MNPIEQTISDSIEAIRHYDDGKAKLLIRDAQILLASKNGQQINPGMLEKLQHILIHLKLVAIPKLTDEEAIDIIRTNFLDSFEAEIDMENRLTAKLFLVPEIPRDELRKKLKKALLENTQRLGPFTVGQWIAEFEKEYDVKSRSLSASVDFVRNNRNTLTLDPTLRTHLKELLYTYDYLLVTTLPFTGPALEELIASDLGEDAGIAVGSTPSFHSSRNLPREFGTENIGEIKTENLPISTALEKYPAIGEQLITSTHIKLKTYPEPVRPSIKNWLADYTFVVGISNHDPIVRGNYLYKNENAVRLSNNDREKLSTILKSFEEKNPLTVNVNTKQIIFSTPERKEFPKNPLVDLSGIDSNTEPAEINRSPKRTEVEKEPVVNLKNPDTTPEPPKTIRNQESYPQQRLASLRQKAEPDAKRLSAWRRDLPQKESSLHADKAEGNVHFYSPQTFSTEKSTEKPKEAPSISRPSFPQLASITKKEPSAPKRPMPKNVVDLREE